MTEHNWDDNGVCQNHGTHCSMAERAPGRCGKLATKGTGVGVCDTPLDDHGNCSNASNHKDETASD